MLTSISSLLTEIHFMLTLKFLDTSEDRFFLNGISSPCTEKLRVKKCDIISRHLFPEGGISITHNPLTIIFQTPLLDHIILSYDIVPLNAPR